MTALPPELTKPQKELLAEMPDSLTLGENMTMSRCRSKGLKPEFFSHLQRYSRFNAKGARFSALDVLEQEDPPLAVAVWILEQTDFITSLWLALDVAHLVLPVYATTEPSDIGPWDAMDGIRRFCRGEIEREVLNKELAKVNTNPKWEQAWDMVWQHYMPQHCRLMLEVLRIIKQRKRR